MTLRRFVLLCLFLALSVSFVLPAAAQTDTTTPTATPTNETVTNGTATPEPTPVSSSDAVDLRVSIGEQRIVEGMLIERTELPTLDIEVRSTENIRLVAIRQDNERVNEYRPGGKVFEQRVRPELENERNEMRIIVDTNEGSSESLTFNYTYDTRGPYMVFNDSASNFNSAGRNRVVTSNGTVYQFERNESRSVIPEGLVFIGSSDMTFEGTVVDASGSKRLYFDHSYPRYQNGPDINRTPWERELTPPQRIYRIEEPIFFPPATINEVELEFRDKLGNIRGRTFRVYVDDDEPPVFDVGVAGTDRSQQLVRPTVPDADLEMIDDSSDGQGRIRSAIQDQSSFDDDEDDSDTGDSGTDSDDSLDTDYEIPGDGNEPICDSNRDDGELDSDPIPDEYSHTGNNHFRANTTTGSVNGQNVQAVLHPTEDHNDFDPDVYGQHYCAEEGPRFFGNPDWPFEQGGPYNASTGESDSLENEAMEYETINWNCGGSCSFSADTIYDPDQEDEDNDQAINVDLEEAPRDSTANKRIRIKGTISDNAQLRRVTVRVGWHPKNVSDRRGLGSDSAGVSPFRNQRNLSGLYNNESSEWIKNSFSYTADDNEENNLINCREESNDLAMDNKSGIVNVNSGEVGPQGPDNDPGGDVSICEDSRQPVLLFYEQHVLSPIDARKLGAEFQTIEINETIPLKNRTGETITNVVEVEAQDFQGHEQRRLAIVEKEPLQPEPIIDIDPQRTRTTSDNRLNIAARVFDGLVRTVTVETRKDGSIYDFAEVHNGSTRTDVRIRETLDRPDGPTRVVIRAVDINGRVYTESLRVGPIQTRTPTETPFQTEDPNEGDETPDPPEPETPLPTPSATPPPLTPANNTTTPPSARGAVLGDNFGFAAVAIALLSVAALARRRIV